MNWSEKTLKIAKIIVSVLGILGVFITGLVAVFANQGIDISVLATAAGVIDALAAAIAAFFGIKQGQIIAAQKATIAEQKRDIASMKANQFPDEH